MPKIDPSKKVLRVCLEDDLSIEKALMKFRGVNGGLFPSITPTRVMLEGGLQCMFGSGSEDKSPPVEKDKIEYTKPPTGSEWWKAMNGLPYDKSKFTVIDSIPTDEQE